VHDDCGHQSARSQLQVSPTHEARGHIVRDDAVQPDVCVHRDDHAQRQVCQPDQRRVLQPSTLHKSVEQNMKFNGR